MQELGPHLFPLIYRAEVRVTGARVLPAIQANLQFRVADRYEMVGVVDVVTHVELAQPSVASNPIVAAVRQALGPTLPPEFELIIDYKGMRRPPVPKGPGASLWTQYEWQLQTYGGLRQKQDDALRVVAGVLVYVNELHPTRSDIERLQDEMLAGDTDIPPTPGSADEVALRTWHRRSKALPQFSFEYRLARALRIVPISPATVAQAEVAFDKVVKDIETCRGREVHGASLLTAWDRNPSDESTCVVCDSRTFCPDYQAQYAAKHGEVTPRLPATRL